VNKLQLYIEPSKSECNRHLVFRALADLSINDVQTSSADDVKVVKSILNNEQGSHWDVGHAGTAFRFLTAYACLQNTPTVLTGSDRLKERPISELVNALAFLGAEITYLEREGYAPLKIEPTPLTSSKMTFGVLKSSQFISALMLIAPFLPEGLVLELDDDQPSMSYIDLTKSVLESYGVQVTQQKHTFTIEPYTSAIKQSVQIESDWSSASYWYAMSSIFNVPVSLSHFKKESTQGDSALPEIFKQFGVKTKFESNEISIKSYPNRYTDYFEWDCVNCPDIAQTILVVAFILGVPCHLTGLSTLANKECDRLEAMKTELEKFGGKLEILNQNEVKLLKGNPVCTTNTIINTYKDHRMAMAFAPLFMLFADLVEIEQPNVVSKSYPSFWDDVNTFVEFGNSNHQS